MKKENEQLEDLKTYYKIYGRILNRLSNLKKDIDKIDIERIKLDEDYNQERVSIKVVNAVMDAYNTFKVGMIHDYSEESVSIDINDDSTEFTISVIFNDNVEYENLNDLHLDIELYPFANELENPRMVLNSFLFVYNAAVAFIIYENNYEYFINTESTALTTAIDNNVISLYSVGKNITHIILEIMLTYAIMYELEKETASYKIELLSEILCTLEDFTEALLVYLENMMYEVPDRVKNLSVLEFTYDLLYKLEPIVGKFVSLYKDNKINNIAIEDEAMKSRLKEVMSLFEIAEDGGK